MNWPQHNIDKLRNLWPNFSAAEIAATLGEGLTRSAVIGMAHRLKLGGKVQAPRSRAVRTTPFRMPGRPARLDDKPKPLPIQPSSPLAPPPDLPTAPIILNELTHKTCHWPIGDAVPYLFCGRQPFKTSPYCAQHHARSYYPPRSRL